MSLTQLTSPSPWLIPCIGAAGTSRWIQGNLLGEHQPLGGVGQARGVGGWKKEGSWRVFASGLKFPHRGLLEVDVVPQVLDDLGDLQLRQKLLQPHVGRLPADRT